MQSTECARLPARLAALAAGAVAALVLASALTQPSPAAAAARSPHPHVLSRSARMLAGIVRHSARMTGHRGPAGVVTIRCCGHRRTLAVYYRSRPPAGLPWHGTYQFTVRRRGAFLESVGVAFFPTGSRWSYGAAASNEGPRYEFKISSPRHSRGWRLDVSDSYLSCPPPSSGPPQSSAAAQCDGFSDAFSLGERQLGARRVRALLRHALGVVHKARRRVPISGAEAAIASGGSGAVAVRAASAPQGPSPAS